MVKLFSSFSEFQYFYLRLIFTTVTSFPFCWHT